jgi:ERCC4-related helicase
MSERGDPARMGMGKGLKNRISLEIINRASGGIFQTPGAMAFYGKGLQKRGVVIPNPIFIKNDLPVVEQSQREKTMQKYRDGNLAILIATDVASRGIDVDDVDCVVNFDVPEENEYYVHRIGRTGRAKRKGVAYAIISNFNEKAKLDEIAKFSAYNVKPMVMGEDGGLTEEEVKAPAAPRKRFR